MNPIQIFRKINYNIVFPFTPWSSEWSSPFRFSHTCLHGISHLSHACYISCLSRPPWFDRTNYHYAVLRISPSPRSHVTFRTKLLSTVSS